MALDSLTQGAQRQLQDKFGRDTRKLILVLCLPLVDGVFATLLVSGAIETFSDIIAVSLTIFTGAGALAVLYSSTDTVEEAKQMVRNASVVLVLGALLVSLVAPIYEQLFYVGRMQTVAGLALLVISTKMLEIDSIDFLSVPAIIVTGLVLSVKNPGSLVFTFEYVVPGVTTALIASGALYLAGHLDRGYLNLDYVRRGGALVIALISMSMFGVKTPANLELLVFAASVVVSLKPSRLASIRNSYSGR